MPLGLIGRKVGMTQVYDEKGQIAPVTVLQLGPCPVLQVRDPERDGYHAVQVGFQDKPRRIDNQVRAIGARAEPVLTHRETLIPLLRAHDCEARKGHPGDANLRAVAWLQPEATDGERVGGRRDA